MSAEPRWDDLQLRAGTMIRGALWLSQVVGQGNVFTKEQLRAAFPGVSQADRRVRDLRDFGWVVDTNLSDVTLTSEEQRFTKQGIAVWDPVARRAAARNLPAITSKDRAATFAADDYQCVICGIAGGEPYPDDSGATAVLAISRRTVDHGPEQTAALVTECKRCRAGAPTRTYSTIEARALVDQLSAEDLGKLKRWLTRGARGTTPLDRAWNAIRQLPAELRQNVIGRI